MAQHFLLTNIPLFLVSLVFGVILISDVKAEDPTVSPSDSLIQERDRLRNELHAIKANMEAAALRDMEEETMESNESHSRSRGLRGKRASSQCDGGTVSQWACGSQCIFKLKGLCGLSLRAMCHC